MHGVYFFFQKTYRQAIVIVWVRGMVIIALSDNWAVEKLRCRTSGTLPILDAFHEKVATIMEWSKIFLYYL